MSLEYPRRSSGGTRNLKSFFNLGQKFSKKVNLISLYIVNVGALNQLAEILFSFELFSKYFPVKFLFYLYKYNWIFKSVTK